MYAVPPHEEHPECAHRMFRFRFDSMYFCIFPAPLDGHGEAQGSIDMACGNETTIRWRSLGIERMMPHRRIPAGAGWPN